MSLISDIQQTASDLTPLAAVAGFLGSTVALWFGLKSKRSDNAAAVKIAAAAAQASAKASAIEGNNQQLTIAFESLHSQVGTLMLSNERLTREHQECTTRLDRVTAVLVEHGILPERRTV